LVHSRKNLCSTRISVTQRPGALPRYIQLFERQTPTTFPNKCQIDIKYFPPFFFFGLSVYPLKPSMTLKYPFTKPECEEFHLFGKSGHYHYPNLLLKQQQKHLIIGAEMSCNKCFGGATFEVLGPLVHDTSRNHSHRTCSCV